MVDRLKLPVLDRLFGKRRSWILLAQAGIATGLYLMSQTNALAAPETLALFGLLVAFSSATQDVAIDAYRIEIEDLFALYKQWYIDEHANTAMWRDHTPATFSF